MPPCWVRVWNIPPLLGMIHFTWPFTYLFGCIPLDLLGWLTWLLKKYQDSWLMSSRIVSTNVGPKLVMSSGGLSSNSSYRCWWGFQNLCQQVGGWSLICWWILFGELAIFDTRGLIFMSELRGELWRIVELGEWNRVATQSAETLGHERLDLLYLA